MTLSRTMISVLSCCFVFTAVGLAQEVKWFHDLPAARAAAREQNRPIVIDFGTLNCCWCRQLDATTLRDPTIARLLSERFVAVKIDASADPNLAQTMGVNAFPTLIFAAPDGKVLGRQEGYVDVPQFQSLLLKAISRSNASAPPSGPSATSQLPSHVPSPARPSAISAPWQGNRSGELQTTGAVQMPFPRNETIRLQAPELPSMPPPAVQLLVPSPEELGVVKRQEPTSEFAVLFARLRQLGAVGFHLERISSGYHVSIDLPGSARKITTVEGWGANEESAVAMALAHADARR
jgi:thioredoxin-related protein